MNQKYCEEDIMMYNGKRLEQKCWRCKNTNVNDCCWFRDGLYPEGITLVSGYIYDCPNYQEEKYDYAHIKRYNIGFKHEMSAKDIADAFGFSMRTAFRYGLDNCIKECILAKQENRRPDKRKIQHRRVYGK